MVRDADEAVRWLRKAAEQGNADAQNNLGGLYFSDKDVAQNDEEAYFWLTVASNSGDKRFAAMRDHIAGLLTPQQISDSQKRARDWNPAPAQ